MIVLANRPGFPFLGNDFFASLGMYAGNFYQYVVTCNLQVIYLAVLLWITLNWSLKR